VFQVNDRPLPSLGIVVLATFAVGGVLSMKQVEIMWFQQQFRPGIDEEELSLWQLGPQCKHNQPDFQTNTESKPSHPPRASGLVFCDQ
jgi:hypothetical protein